jgi:aspartyl-tRNA synthetase
MRVKEVASSTPILKFLDEKTARHRRDARRRCRRSVLIVAGERHMTNHVLGILRLDLGRPPVNEGGLQLQWVVDFPLFEALDPEGRPIPAHHPFTMPHPEDLDLLDSSAGDDLLNVRSQAYDLVLNGWELGSGSVRIHSPVVQQKIFSFLGIGPEEAQRALRVPARRVPVRRTTTRRLRVRVDRLVALLAGEENIREVIAFPKTQKEARTGDRCAERARPAQLTELGIVVKPKVQPKP